MLAVLFLGSPSDQPFAEQITQRLTSFAIPWKLHVASAHKTPRRLLELLEIYEADPTPKVYITIAGRSNALSGLVDAQVTAPVIACPPYADRFGGADLFSSLRMPSGVAPAVVLEPAGAALLAAKMLGLTARDLRERIEQAQNTERQRVLEANE